MIDEIDILQYCKSCDFSRNAGKEAHWLFCIITYHHELIIELGEKSFDSFSEFTVCPDRRTPILLIEPIRHFQRNMCDIKEVLLNICAEVTFIAKHQAIAVLPFDILEIMYIRHVGCSRVITVNYSRYSTDCVEFITIIVHALRCAIAPCWSQLRRILSHCATSSSGVLAYFYRFGIYAEYIFAPIHGRDYVLADFFSKTVSEFATLIVLTACDKIGKTVGALILQAMKQVVLAVDAEDFRSGGKGENFQVRELGNHTSSRHVSEVINTISGKFLEYVENFSELYDEVVHTRDDVNYRFGYL